MGETTSIAAEPAAEDPGGRPRVLVVCGLSSPVASGELRQILGDLADHAVAKLVEAGFDPRLLDTAGCDEPVDTLLDGADAVLVLGGADIDPGLYGQTERDPANYGSNPQVDKLELSLTERTLERDVPFLGFCRGMQVLNVARGGTLIQDLGEGTLHNNPRMEDGMVDHPVHIESGTILGEIFGPTLAEVQSGHHQAIARVGDGLVVAARADDGVVEALEVPGQWAVAVQWHPESPAGNAGDLAALLGAFAAAARADAPDTAVHPDAEAAAPIPAERR